MQNIFYYNLLYAYYIQIYAPVINCGCVP